MKYILIILIIFITSCNNECEVKDKTFRKHLLWHYHKSKEYPYYHNNPCDCIKYGDYYNKKYRRDSRDYIKKYY